MAGVTALVVIALALGFVLTVATAWHVTAIITRNAHDQLRRSPPLARRRAVRGATAAGVWIVVGSVLVIVQPWDRRTLLYVFGFAALVLFGIVVGVVVVELTRRRGTR
jgi:hypothetical protein